MVNSYTPFLKYKVAVIILCRFDKNVEKELNKFKETSEAMVEAFVDPTASQKSSRYISPRMAQSSTSGIDISERLRSAPDTELTEAVEKLAKAEAALYFAGAVRAAEEAAAAAPPELAEEAAAAGARGFHAEITDVFHDTSGNKEKPIQVLGYIGITRPKKPRRP